VLGLLLLGLPAAQPAAADAGPDAASAPPQDEAPVIVFNRTIALLRAPFLGVSAADRARRTEQNIAELLDRGGSGVVSIQSAPQGSLILVDGTLALILTPNDTDSLRGETLAAMADASAANLKRVIAATREARDRSRALHAIFASAIATAVLLLAWFLIRRARTWLEARLATLLQRQAERVQLGGEQVLRGNRIGVLVARRLVDVIAWGLLGVLTYRWTSFVLYRFPYTRVWGDQLDQYLLGLAADIAAAILHAVPGLLFAFVIFAMARGLIALVVPFFEVIRNRGNVGWLDRDTAKATRRLFNTVVWLFAMVMAYPYLPGSGSDAFKGLSVLIGLMVTLGGTSLFGQAASGLILMYSRSIRVGEYVRIGEQEGTVMELGTFTTRLRSGLGEEISLSNSVVIAAVTKNYSRAVQGHGYVVDTNVTIGYDTPWRQVEAMLLEAAAATLGILREPSPRVFKTELTDFYVAYRLVCQAVLTEPRPRAELLSELHAKILDTFNKYGVQITSPHYFTDPAQRKVVVNDAWFAAPARKPPSDASG
jgi:small-conductance mechanosensitive channel